MRFQITLFAALISILLAACGGDPGGHNPYDGAWTLSFSNLVPPASTGETVSCIVPLVSITLSNGAGTTTPVETCDYSTAASGIIATTTNNLLTAVNVSGQGIKAIVNGNTYSGTCVSQNGCAAQESTGAGSITMIR